MEFTVTEDHLKLFTELTFRYEDGIEFGAPAVDPKRPYGNSSVFMDMREILGEDYEDHELLALHESLRYVLQLVCCFPDTAPNDLVGRTFESSYGYRWKESE